MSEKHVSVTLTFATDSNPAAVGSRVAEVVVAEVAANLIGVNWHGFELDETEGDSTRSSDSGTKPPTTIPDGSA